jgi:uncharacterized protein
MDAIYDFTIPVFIKILGGLKGVLKKAAAHGGDEQAMLIDRIAPDMYPLVRQVQLATDMAKGAATRLSGQENPVYEDTEKTFAELDARIDKTIKLLESVSRESFKNAADIKISLKYWNGKSMKGFDYAREYAIPNFFFHVAMTYALVRKNGVQIGKSDYINGLQLQDL